MELDRSQNEDLQLTAKLPLKKVNYNPFKWAVHFCEA